MRRAGIVFGALLAVTLVVAPPLAGRAIAGAEEPTILEVDPPAGHSHPGAEIAVIGDGFEPGARVGLLDGGPFRVAVGDVPFASYTRDLAVRDGHAYLATNRGLCVFDVRDPENPVFLTSAGASFRGVDVSDGHAFAVNEGGLMIYDVAAPGSPVRVAWIPGPGGGSRAVRVSGSLAYVVGDTAFDVIDVSVPAAPRWVGNLPLAGGRDVEVGDGVAYVAGMDAGVHIVDVGNPEAPALLSTRALQRGEAVAVALQDRRLFVGSTYGLRLEIWDVDAPDQPSLVGFHDGAWIEDVAVEGDFAYLSSGLVLDVGDPSSPAFAGKARHTWPGNVVVEGDHAYASGSGGDLIVVDIRHPAGPRHPRVLRTSGCAADVDVSGRIAYVAAGNGVEIFDVEDMTNPVTLGAVSTPSSARSAWHLKAAGDYAFVLVYGRPARILAIDATDTSSPRIVDEYDLDPWSWDDVDFDLAGGHLLVASGGKFQVIDAGDPSNLSVEGEIELPYDGYLMFEKVMAHGDVAYVARGEFDYWEGEFDRTHFYVVDIEDPADPRIVGTTEFGDEVVPIQPVPGDPTRIVATGAILDVSDPEHPRFDGRMAIATNDLRIVDDRVLYSWRGDLRVGALESWEHLPVLSSYHIPFEAGAFKVVGNHVLVTEGCGYTTDALMGVPDVRIVRLNGPVGEVRHVTPAELRATVPAGYNPGPYDVLVTNPDGYQALLPNAYRVLPNEPPVARAGEDATFECAGNLSATVSLDGSGSTDPDSTSGTQDDIDRFRWYLNRDGDDPVLVGTDSKVEATLPLGEHVVTLEVTDTKGASGTDQVIVRVADTIPPEVTAQMTPLIGNGRPRSTFDGTWTVAFGAVDVCDPSPEVSGVIVLPEGSDDDHVTYTPLNDPLHSEINLYSDPTPACPERREFALVGRDEAAMVECLHEAWALGGVAVLDGQRLRLGVRRSGGASVSLASTTMSPERVTKKRHLRHYELDGGVLSAASASGPEADVVLSVRATDHGYPSANAATASIGLVEAMRRLCNELTPGSQAVCRGTDRGSGQADHSLAGPRTIR